MCACLCVDVFVLTPRLTLSPSELQSEMGQPWSGVENGHAPLEMWRYHLCSGGSASDRTWSPKKVYMMISAQKQDLQLHG